MIYSQTTNGIAVYAEYAEQEIPQFRDNPFLEALPPIMSREEARSRMARYPAYDPADRLKRAEVRDALAAGLSTIIRHPVGVTLELAARISNLIRWSYVARNPALPTFQATIDARERALVISGKGNNLAISGPMKFGGEYGPLATGLTVVGITGIGKTVATEMPLGLYPELIIHTEYKGRPFTKTQVVRLRMQCPSDGSILTLCTNFFGEMDRVHRSAGIETNYQGAYVPNRPTIQKLIPAMARLAAEHGLGVLVLDEVQDLNRRGSRAILSFLVQLVNTIGVPVILVGGIDALPVLSAQFRQARRGASLGDMILDRAVPGTQWRKFCEMLWKFQYTRKETPLTDELVDVLYEESQGITDYLVTLYIAAQQRAISTGREEITPTIIRNVAQDSLGQARPVLLALKRGEMRKLRLMGDVVPPEGFGTVPFLPGDPQNVRSTAPARPSRSEESVPPVHSAMDSNATDLPAVSPLPAKRTRKAVDREDSIPALVHAGEIQGLTPHAALVQHGLIGDELWKAVVGRDAVEALG
jgi:hypothetical protein